MIEHPKVYVIVVHYGTWEDTIACLRSLEQLVYRPFEVYVVDNGSAKVFADPIDGVASYPLHQLALPDNRGFAAGANAGLTAALARGDGRFYWILNNDTEVSPDSLSHLVDTAEADRAEGRRIGQYGSKLIYDAPPGVLQAVGARYNKWWALTREIGHLELDRGQYDHPAPRADILIGASLFVTDEFLRDVGLLGEDYFLYYEEHDWAVRGKRKGWGLKIVPRSVVRHKQGATTRATNVKVSAKSYLSDYYSIRNRLLFTARYFPYCLPTVYLSLAGSGLLRLQRGQWDRLPLILQMMATFWKKPLLEIAP